MLIINKEKLSESFPTDMLSPKFWESLGRAIATCSYLELALKIAIFAISSQQEIDETDERKMKESVENWFKFLGSVQTLQLSNLVDRYEKVVNDSAYEKYDEFDDLIHEMKEAATLRNLLCHAAWKPHNSPDSSLPIYVDRTKGEFLHSIDIAFLQQTQKAVAEMAVEIIDSVSRIGGTSLLELAQNNLP